MRAERKIEYKKFGFGYIAGRKVCHIHLPGRIKTQCGLTRLGLVVSSIDEKTCRNCVKTIKVIRQLGKRIAIFKNLDGVISAVEWRI